MSSSNPRPELRKNLTSTLSEQDLPEKHIIRCSGGVYIIDMSSPRRGLPVKVYKRSDSSDSRKTPCSRTAFCTKKASLSSSVGSDLNIQPMGDCRLSKNGKSDVPGEQSTVVNGNADKDSSVSDTLELIEVSVERLRYILHQLNRGEIPLDDLKKNIEYAALVLETAYMDESRRLCEEDDDLAEVTPEAVPDEVREWLAATFTRQTASKREKPKFKSVANAIRTGIFFDKMFRKLSGAAPQAPIPAHIATQLKDCCSWEFDIFELNEVTENHALKYIGLELFNRYNLLSRFKIPYQILDKFLGNVEAGYSLHNNPYHNLVHAADITQTAHWMISQTGLLECLSELEVFAVILSSIIHDYEHTGHTNNFHIQSSSNFALLYNDKSVLENHHVSSCFRLLKDPEMNILACLSKEEYRELRNLVVEIVLATDMSMHFVQVKNMKSMLSLPEGIGKTKALSLIVHCCDISHPAKPWRIHNKWTSRVLEEFFRQGDLEQSLGLPYSPLCDRHSTHIAESQIGFIDFIVEPTMSVCGDMLVKLVEPLVAMPPSHLSASPSTNALSDLDSTNSTGLTPSPSPFPGINGREGSRKLPMTSEGKLCIPQPWAKKLHENKFRWKEQAALEEKERKKREAEKEKENQ